VPVHRYDEQFKPVKATADGRFIGEGVYKPLVAPKLFDAAQKQLATFVLKEDGGHGRMAMHGMKTTGENGQYLCF
jgi:hypothetical protein